MISQRYTNSDSLKVQFFRIPTVADKSRDNIAGNTCNRKRGHIFGIAQPIRRQSRTVPQWAGLRD